jgi:hypothetical protein
MTFTATHAPLSTYNCDAGFEHCEACGAFAFSSSLTENTCPACYWDQQYPECPDCENRVRVVDLTNDEDDLVCSECYDERCEWAA